jgi:hypothetical protein
MIETYKTTLPTKKLQQKILQLLCKINGKEFSFEETANPTIPECKIIFEFGIADAESFNYIDEEELKKAQALLRKENLTTIDFFCAIRYYKNHAEKKTPLKFDYYLLRTLTDQNTFEIQVFHKRGPRYLSPEDLTLFIVNKTNESSNRKILNKEAE